MNCAHVHDRLPDLLYGDLPAAEAVSIQEHLRGCVRCRGEYGALEHLRQALDSVPTPAVTVDLSRIYREAAERQVQRARRWRRAAVGCASVAAALILAFFLRLEVRLEARQVVVRWGAVPPSPPVQPEERQPAVAVPSDLPVDLDRRLQLMNDLIHALATDTEARDAYQQQNLVRVQARLEDLERRGNLRWAKTENTVAVLYAAQFAAAKKGDDR